MFLKKFGVNRGFFKMKKTEEKSQELQKAFAAFNAVSEQLTEVYGALENRVASLTKELAIANGKLLKQFQEKEALSERLSRLLDSLPAAVLEIDLENKIVSNNPAAQLLFSENLENQNWEEFQNEHFEKTSTVGEFLFQKKGESKWVSVAQSPLKNGTIILIHDISEAERLKMEVERNHRLAAMGEMAASLAHQLRTPLAAALLYTANLAKTEMSAESRAKFAEKASNQLKRLERFIQDILLFAKGETIGKDSILINDLTKDLSQTILPLAQKKGVVFLCVDETQNVRITGAKKALLGAFINLLENALYATPEGKCVQLRAFQNTKHIVVEVKDEGEGMDSELQRRIFEPFFTTKAEGSGLGLAIALGVFRSHHGELKLFSAPGEGSTFQVFFPIPVSC